MIISDALVSKIITSRVRLCVLCSSMSCVRVGVDTLTWQGGTDRNRFAASTITLGSVSPHWYRVGSVCLQVSKNHLLQKKEKHCQLQKATTFYVPSGQRAELQFSKKTVWVKLVKKGLKSTAQVTKGTILYFLSDSVRVQTVTQLFSTPTILFSGQEMHFSFFHEWPRCCFWKMLSGYDLWSSQRNLDFKATS